MAKFKVVKPYYDIELEKYMNAGKDKEVEMTIKRATEINDKLGDEYLARVDVEEKVKEKTNKKE